MGKRITDGAIALFIVIFVALFLLMIPKKTSADEPQGNLIPAVSDWSRLEPRQYLYLKYPDVAAKLDRIIGCESGWTSTVKNPDSTATGLAQFINSTWTETVRRMGEDWPLELRLDPYRSIDAAAWLIREDSDRHWSESAHCWKK